MFKVKVIMARSKVESKLQDDFAHQNTTANVLTKYPPLTSYVFQDLALKIKVMVIVARSKVSLFIWGFYVAFNTMQVISRRVVGRADETSTYSS